MEYKNKEFQLLILIILVFSIILSTVLILLDNARDNEPKKSLELECFQICINICDNRDSKIASFTSTKNQCSCNCFNGESETLILN